MVGLLEEQDSALWHLLSPYLEQPRAPWTSNPSLARPSWVVVAPCLLMMAFLFLCWPPPPLAWTPGRPPWLSLEVAGSERRPSPLSFWLHFQAALVDLWKQIQSAAALSLPCCQQRRRHLRQQSRRPRSHRRHHRPLLPSWALCQATAPCPRLSSQLQMWHQARPSGLDRLFPDVQELSDQEQESPSIWQAALQAPRSTEPLAASSHFDPPSLCPPPFALPLSQVACPSQDPTAGPSTLFPLSTSCPSP